MCNNNPRQTSDNSGNSEGEFWQGIYPDLREFLQPSNNTPQQNPSRMAQDNAQESWIGMLLMQLLGVTPDQVQARSRQDEGNPTPSAPPSEDTSNNNGHGDQQSSNGQQQGSEDGQYQTGSNGNGHQQSNTNGQQQQPCNNCRFVGGQQRQQTQVPEFVPILVSRFHYFTNVFSKTLSTVMMVSAMALFIFMLPHCLVSNIVFMVIAAGLGLHVPSVIAGNIILSILGRVNPIILIIFGLWAYRRTVLNKQPLFRHLRMNIFRNCQPRQHQD